MQPHAHETAAPFSVAENRGTQSRMRTPSATRVTRVAAESLGTLGIEHSLTSGRPRQTHGLQRDATSSPAASDLGLGLRSVGVREVGRELFAGVGQHVAEEGGKDKASREGGENVELI